MIVVVIKNTDHVSTDGFPNITGIATKAKTTIKLLITPNPIAWLPAVIPIGFAHPGVLKWLTALLALDIQSLK